MISCNQHDYIEIACMYRLPLVLTLMDGSIIACEAKDTLRNAQKQECLLVTQEGGDVLVILDELKSMRATIENPHFDLVVFHSTTPPVQK